MSELRAAVVGVGAFGRHHARIWHSMTGQEIRLVGLVDIDPGAPRDLAQSLGVPLARRIEDLPEPVDVVSVAVPTVEHRRVAEPLLARGIHCLVEKPIAGSSEDAEALLEAARRGGAVLQVGLVERFNPVLAALDRLGSPPVFLEVHRLAPFSFRAADVGVVMDLMIHDLDIVNHLVGEEAVRVDAVGVPVLSAHEDIANARLTFPSGCVANVTASRVSLQRMRRIRIFSRESYLSLDYDRREAVLVRKAGGVPTDLPRGDRRGPGSFEDMLDVEKLEIPHAEPLREEIAALVDAIRGSGPPLPGGREGIAALRLAERILSDLRGRPVPSASDRTAPMQVPGPGGLTRSAPP